MIHHRVDRVLEFENLAFHVHADFSRKIAARHRRRHLGDVAHLRGQIRSKDIHVVGEVFPRARDARHNGLAAETSIRADLARHARHLGRERAKLLHHRVQRLLQ